MHKKYATHTKKGYMEQKIRGAGYLGEANIKQRFELDPNKVLEYIEIGKKVFKNNHKLQQQSIVRQMHEFC